MPPYSFAFRITDMQSANLIIIVSPYCVYELYVLYQYAPHKAVAEVSK